MPTSFKEEFAKFCENPERTKFRELLKQTIIAEYHQVGHWRAHGLSLYFPPKNSIYIYDESYKLR